jgi:hypothetical protein
LRCEVQHDIGRQPKISREWETVMLEQSILIWSASAVTVVIAVAWIYWLRPQNLTAVPVREVRNVDGRAVVDRRTLLELILVLSLKYWQELP